MPKTVIEDEFPFEVLSEVAEVESWRKEVYRPIYHMHKWWARRLGSVFRAVILAAAMPSGSDVMSRFYESVDLDGLIVFDPFMGSGTTIGEAHKLGCIAIGRDINPVAYKLVRTALSDISRRRLLELYGHLQDRVGQDLRDLYRSKDSRGQECDVLYYFWVKVLPCPSCHKDVDLFSTYVFARHADASKSPQVQVVCPACGEIVSSTLTASKVDCPTCQHTFDPQRGPAERTHAYCHHCGQKFPIAETSAAQGCAPRQRLYAKLILRTDGEKEYLRISEQDLSAYQAAQLQLDALSPRLPRVGIAPGYNTQQILNHGYRRWHEMFNDRQLLALSRLAGAIRELPICRERDVLMLLFSGVLEFNNMFASYKGEGTGAVRHLFSHHILKPERMPIEANVWGTNKSSGAFSTLFKSRILRAVDYKEMPFEVSIKRNGKRKVGKKVFGVSRPIRARVLDVYPQEGLDRSSVYLSCGNSSQMDLPTASVDLVVTDPPFFDNVHYSELADFFHVWLDLYFGTSSEQPLHTTRHPGEVQNTDADEFARRLAEVLQECQRVLREDGLLVFSYHHSRPEGWRAIAKAVLSSGFSFVQSQPVKAEMSVATPKSQAKDPIDIDILLVCKKHARNTHPRVDPSTALSHAIDTASARVKRFNTIGKELSVNDVRVILMSQVLVKLCAGRTAEEFNTDFQVVLQFSEAAITELHAGQEQSLLIRSRESSRQLALF